MDIECRGAISVGEGRGGEDMTRTAKHTPGPWFYNYDDHCIVNQAGVSVVNVHGAMSGNDTNADIALIAAAPAMHEALHEMENQLDQFTVKAQEELGLRGALEKIRAALAQAEDRQ